MIPTNILALDTACSQVAACLLAGQRAFYIYAGGGLPRSVSLAPSLAELLHQAGLGWQDIDAFALGRGPGSFTGIRIGAATIAGLNSGLKRPLLHLSSLAISAMQADTDAAVHVLEDARAGEAFMACYKSGDALSADCCLRWDDVADMPPASFVSHADPAVPLPGWQRLPLTLSRDEALALALRHAASRVPDWQALPRYPEPVYLQPSQAERNAHV
ncbi:MAG TPA: tRNA (adenosine(37)-N6)-threonylcarbamoyltransferase complex dimerization subunit type 1 TsaB [Mariprofundaceae bacterium]|nr:tRNA (adenosine(37)-N6)-threonylcarbamoyltransferase complex dimerization subunit type 1 TsaB [Mariprofundaceae bacterium]